VNRIRKLIQWTIAKLQALDNWLIDIEDQSMHEKD